MNIIISGSRGTLGTHITQKLINKKYKVLEIIRDNNNYVSLKHNTLKVFSSLDQNNFIKKISDFKPDIFIHLASHITSGDSFDDADKILKTNKFLIKVLDAIKFLNIKLFINTGSFAEFNGREIDPAYLYTSAKVADKYYLKYYSKTYKFKHINVIPYTIYGGVNSKKKILDLIIESLNNPKKINFSPGHQRFDFVYIEDVVDFYIKLIENHNQLDNGIDYHIGTCTSTSIKELVYIIQDLTKTKANINWGGKKYRPNDIMDSFSPSINIFDLKMTSLRNGLKKYLKKYIEK